MVGHVSMNVNRIVLLFAAFAATGLLAQEPPTKIPMRAGNLDCVGFIVRGEWEGLHIVCSDLANHKVVDERDLPSPKEINVPSSITIAYREDRQQWALTRAGSPSKGTAGVYWSVVTSGNMHAYGEF